MLFLIARIDCDMVSRGIDLTLRQFYRNEARRAPWRFECEVPQTVSGSDEFVIADNLHLDGLVRQDRCPRIPTIDDLQAQTRRLDRFALAAERCPKVFEECCDPAVEVAIAVRFATRTKPLRTGRLECCIDLLGECLVVRPLAVADTKYSKSGFGPACFLEMPSVDRGFSSKSRVGGASVVRSRYRYDDAVFGQRPERFIHRQAACLKSISGSTINDFLGNITRSAKRGAVEYRQPLPGARRRSNISVPSVDRERLGDR